MSFTMSGIYTLEEVARHDSADDVWVIIHGGVYDVTSFLKEHPGGEEVLLNLAGKDGTTCFDNIGHSEEAKQLREKFKIGELIEGGEGTGDQSCTKKEDEASRGTSNSTDDDNWEYVPPSADERSPAIFIIGFLIYAVVIYYIWLR